MLSTLRTRHRYTGEAHRTTGRLSGPTFNRLLILQKLYFSPKSLVFHPNRQTLPLLTLNRPLISLPLSKSTKVTLNLLSLTSIYVSYCSSSLLYIYISTHFPNTLFESKLCILCISLFDFHHQNHHATKNQEPYSSGLQSPKIPMQSQC